VLGVKIEQRYRAEMRWTSNGYRNRFRYRLGTFYPFGKERQGYRPYQLSASNELFFTDREPYFERNRLQFAFNYKPSRNTTLQIGYLHQFDYRINDEIGRDFLVLGYYIELYKRAGVRKVADPGIRED
jgi:long-subunit fatty acid transport protein